MEYNWVFFRFSIFGFMSAKNLAIILSLGSILECQMALIKFAPSHISTILKSKVKIDTLFSLVSDGSIASFFLSHPLGCWLTCWTVKNVLKVLRRLFAVCAVVVKVDVKPFLVKRRLWRVKKGAL